VWLAHGIEPHEHHEETSKDEHATEHDDDHEEHAGAHGDEPAPGAVGGDAERPLEITSVLVRYKSPIAAVELPLLVNRESALQAAAPAFETARLLSLVGIGVDTLRGLGLLLIATAGLSVFIALSNAMQERRYDLAVMRTLGASRAQLFTQPLIEGLLLAGGGALLGILLGHAVAEALGRLLPEGPYLGLSGLTWLSEELYVLLLALGVGLVAALLPAVQAYRTDIAAVLASRA
jgi:putative ABC transport system permease protein